MTSRAGLKQTMHSDEAGRDREAAIQALYDEAVRLVVSEGHNLTEAGQRTGMTKEWVRRTIQSQGLSANSVEARRKEGAGAVQGLKAAVARELARERVPDRPGRGHAGDPRRAWAVARDPVRRWPEIAEQARFATRQAGQSAVQEWAGRHGRQVPRRASAREPLESDQVCDTAVKEEGRREAPLRQSQAQPGTGQEVNLHGATLLSRKIGCFAGGYLQIEQGNELIFELEIDLRQETGGRKSLMCGGRPSDLCVIEAKIYG